MSDDDPTTQPDGVTPFSEYAEPLGPIRPGVIAPNDVAAFDPTRDLFAFQKAQVLVEALPYLQRFAGNTVVVKYGGNAMTKDELKAKFALDVLFLRLAGLRPVIVHGGGPQINAMLDRVGIESEFRGGLRVTTKETMDVVRMVLTGQVQRELVSLINQGRTGDALAVGLAGEDGHLFQGRRRTATVDGKSVDVGHVGDVVNVHPQLVTQLLDAGMIPVVSTVAVDIDDPSTVLNVNADTAAAALAVALDAKKLVMMTDVEGLYSDWPDRDSLLFRVGASQVREMLPTLQSGMVPKMEACLRAVEGGVTNAHIIDGRRPHALLLEIFTATGIGTMVVPDDHPDLDSGPKTSARAGADATPDTDDKEQ